MKGILLITAALALLGFGCNQKIVGSSPISNSTTQAPILDHQPVFKSSDSTNYQKQNYYYPDDAADDEGDGQISDDTYTVQACSSNSGNCYDLEADVSNGQVERIHFPNGGYLNLDGAELDSDGSASGDSYHDDGEYDGDSWNIQCDDCVNF